MNLLFRVLYAQKCSSTHHKLAMDSLRYLQVTDCDDWVRLFLANIELYMDGAKAPDKKFKDFRNHVLHVSDNFWGGAVPTAEQWYARLVEQLKAKDWRRAVYCAGVLSHYVTDPLMPLHTGQTEDEGQVHKFIEWGTCKIYGELINDPQATESIQNWKPPENITSTDWLALLIIDGAQAAHGYYDVMIDHYDPAIGRRKPENGFDETSKAALAELLGRSVKAWAHILDQAIIESRVSPPKRSLSIATVLSGLSTPLFWITRKLHDKKDRDAVQKIWDELQATGKVINALPEDDRTIRSAHADEVLGVSIEELDRKPVRKAGSLHRPPQPPTVLPLENAKVHRPKTVRFYLELDSPIVDAPSIGPRTARRLKQIDIHTVEELLDANADDATDQLDQRWITIEVFRKWQQQSTMMCRIPGLRGHDAQLLVEVGIQRPEQLQRADADELFSIIQDLSATPKGKRILRGSTAPDLAEIQYWLELSSKSRALRAA